jgi:hypothetical protein
MEREELTSVADAVEEIRSRFKDEDVLALYCVPVPAPLHEELSLVLTQMGFRVQVSQGEFIVFRGSYRVPDRPS